MKLKISRKLKIKKKTINLIRYFLLLAAAIITGLMFFSNVLLIIGLMLELITRPYSLTAWDFIITCIIGVVFIIIASNASRYKPFNLNSRIQRQKIAKYISWAKSFQEDENERIIISLVLGEDSPWASPYSDSDEPILNASVAEYLEDRLTMLPSVQEFVLHVSGSRHMCDEEKTTFRNALKKYYAGKYVILKASQRKTTNSAIGFIIIGVIVIAISLIMLAANSSYKGLDWTIPQKICDIVGTVCIWESTYILFVNRLPLMHHRMRYLMLANMEVVFLDEKINETAAVKEIKA